MWNTIGNCFGRFGIDAKDLQRIIVICVVNLAMTCEKIKLSEMKKCFDHRRGRAALAAAKLLPPLAEKSWRVIGVRIEIPFGDNFPTNGFCYIQSDIARPENNARYTLSKRVRSPRFARCAGQ